MKMSYNTGAIRALLNAAYSDEELVSLCFDHFRSVHDKFAAGTNRSSKIATLIEHCDRYDEFNELLVIVKQDNPTQYYKFVKEINLERYYECFGGYEILQLLNELDPEALRSSKLGVYKDYGERFNDAYRKRFKDTGEVIATAQKELMRLNRPPATNLADPHALAYARGKYNLLLASIYLEQQKLADAETCFLKSEEEFHFRQWWQLESLAYLGLAITQRKLGKLKEASEACDGAQDSVDQEPVLSKINTEDLREAIKKQRELIDEQLVMEEAPPTQPTEGAIPPSEEEGKPTSSIPTTEGEEYTPPIESSTKNLPVFKISTGDGVNVVGGTTNLNLLSLQDYYDQIAPESPEIVAIDLKTLKNRKAPNADYILEIDENIAEAIDGIDIGDWLLMESDPEKLKNGHKVAVLTRKAGEICVSLKTYTKADNHYFLEAQSKATDSIIIAHYNADYSKISDYYAVDGKRVVRKLAYDVRISGIVRNRIPQKNIKNVVRGFVWNVPIVNDIAAGIGYPIAEDKIKGHRELELEENTGYFIAVVDGDSMTGDGIFPEDYALIRQQPTVKQGDIAAIVIMTPQMEPVGVLKRYYVVHEKREDLRHWLLESSNPKSEHLVVMPEGVDEKAIEKIYEAKVKAGKIIPPKFYKEAEIAVAGKYIRVVGKRETLS